VVLGVGLVDFGVEEDFFVALVEAVVWLLLGVDCFVVVDGDGVDELLFSAVVVEMAECWVLLVILELGVVVKLVLAVDIAVMLAVVVLV